MKFISWRPPEQFSAAVTRQTRTLASTPMFAGQATAARTRHGNTRMDMTWVTGRIAVGGGIWSAENMAAVARAGITHIIDMQIEFDDTPLAEPHGIEVLWNPADDDFQPKPRGAVPARRGFCATGPRGRTSSAIHPLRRGGPPRPHDDAGGSLQPGMGFAGRHADHFVAAPVGGLRGSVRPKRRKFSARAGDPGNRQTADRINHGS